VRGGDDGLRARVARLQKELEALTAERDQLVQERDSLHSQLERLHVSAGQNEDRAVKAYARLKNDEKLREKARKALSVALQLLQDDRPDDDDEDGKKVSAKA
jgi:predicted  nucleic acid-binding Zn-ribbon protein